MKTVIKFIFFYLIYKKQKEYGNMMWFTFLRFLICNMQKRKSENQHLLYVSSFVFSLGGIQLANN